MELKDSIISTRKRANYPSGNGIYCIGSKEKSKFFEDEEGATRLAWDQEPASGDYKKIRAVRLFPTKAQASKNKFPAYIKDLEQLSFLDIPVSFLPHLKQEDLPAGLKTLRISNTEEYGELVAKKLPEWPDIKLPELKALIFFTSFTATELPSLFNISQEHVPSLEYLECRMDKKGHILKEIAKFTSLLHLEVEFAYSFDIMSNINSPLQALSIIGADKGFPTDKLSRLTHLQTTFLNSISAVIDCNVFTTLPNLLEVNVINSKKIEHPEALLACKKLKSIMFTNCGQPFKKIKDQFTAKEYDRLDIKYS
ncbi:hypothetical protein [Chitinophaga filiformis]|uniref:Leucine rich repeat-containing protein n=1 Tax=Chitinophaga filiformis TaxID=104663 RepID=A0A1G7R9Z9_CHIFI|nr:hypothetical protein [Chitinophaga filiformis]SDG06989.1 hypothetical protein SAMN04488121_103366 [Chitinophaga filiformis]